MNPIIIGFAQALLNIAQQGAVRESQLPLGYLVVGIIETPVLILLLATFFGKPRQYKITGVFISFIGMMVILFISAVFGLSYLLGIFY
jgi:uncharacterized membrane protein YeaQ/YmgE (transglycosylase-associated protein family)